MILQYKMSCTFTISFVGGYYPTCGGFNTILATPMKHVGLKCWFKGSTTASFSRYPYFSVFHLLLSADLPSSPTDVEFTVFTVIDGTASLMSIITSWSVDECLNCTQPLGYIVTCCVPGSELTTTVWKSDIAGLDPIQVEIAGVDPATRYVCKVAAFNMYGIGHSGSNIFVDTPEAGN